MHNREPAPQPDEPQPNRSRLGRFFAKWGEATARSHGLIDNTESYPSDSSDRSANDHRLVIPAEQVPSTTIDRRISLPFTEDDPRWQVQRELDHITARQTARRLAVFSGEMAAADCMLCELGQAGHEA